MIATIRKGPSPGPFFLNSNKSLESGWLQFTTASASAGSISLLAPAQTENVIFVTPRRLVRSTVHGDDSEEKTAKSQALLHNHCENASAYPPRLWITIVAVADANATSAPLASREING